MATPTPPVLDDFDELQPAARVGERQIARQSNVGHSFSAVESSLDEFRCVVGVGILQFFE